MDSEMIKTLNCANAPLDQYDLQTINECNKDDPIKKDFYIEDPKVSRLTEDQVKTIRKNANNITVFWTFDSINHENKLILSPVRTFGEAFKYYPDILRVINSQSFREPTPIQMQAWPILMSGTDLVGIAQTGTGKTLAFLLPALIHIERQRRHWRLRPGPTVLILTPTRELAQQIQREIEKFTYNDIQSVCLIGGVPREEQLSVLKKKVAIVVATPGRLNDFIMSRDIDLVKVSYVVLDEADRMLDMGFEPQVRKSLRNIRMDRQVVMTSATWPNRVQRLAMSFMNDPVFVNVGNLDLTATHTVTQRFIFPPEDEDEKLAIFIDLFSELKVEDKVLVFCKRKAHTAHLSSELVVSQFRVRSEAFCSELDQASREQVVTDFNEGSTQVVVATDLASRGLDIQNVTRVINYNFPDQIEEYVHRIGRTGRAGRSGESITFIGREDWHHAEALIKILEEANQEVPQELIDMSRRYANRRQQDDLGSGRGRRGGRGGRRGRGGGRGRGWF